MPYDQFQHLTMQQLEALALLVEERTFARAAQRMGLTQPSISKHIKNLEGLINAPIIDRSRPGIVLTHEGRILHAYARRILRLRDDAREKIVQNRDMSFRHISTGASTIPGSYILPHALSALRDHHPQLIVHIRSGDSQDILEMVAAEQVEIGFIGRGTPDKRFNCEPIWKDTLVLVAVKDHPAARSQDIASLADLPFISREIGSGTRSIIETRLKADDRWSGFNIVSEMGSSEAVKEAVLAGLGVSFLSIHAIRRELSQGLLRRVAWPGSPLSRDIFMVYKKQFKLLPRHDAFMACMRAFKPIE
jgi:DNA-binding transcriptional LysR family regulator